MPPLTTMHKAAAQAHEAAMNASDQRSNRHQSIRIKNPRKRRQTRSGKGRLKGGCSQPAPPLSLMQDAVEYGENAREQGLPFDRSLESAEAIGHAGEILAEGCVGGHCLA